MDSESTIRPVAPDQLGWRKSSRSGPNCDNCVEVAPLRAGAAVRDSKDVAGPVLVFPPDAWREFLGALH